VRLTPHRANRATVTSLGRESSAFTTSPLADDRGPRRVDTDVDVRLLVGDLLAKL
jgi:hypothetical protein